MVEKIVMSGSGQTAGKRENDADVIVIGGGPGGYVSAIKLAQLGAKVILVEKDNLGGTCLNRGCIPTKALLQSVEVLESIRDSEKMGIKVQGYKIDLKMINQRKEQVVSQLVNGVGFLLKSRKVAVVKGTAKFIEDKVIEVSDEKGEKTLLKAKNIIIATGSKPASIPIEGIKGKDIITSTEALNLEQIPESMLIIGGGVIGVELGSIYSSLGSKVTIIEVLPQILPNMDEEVAKTLERILKKEMDIYTGTKVTEIGDRQDKKTVRIKTEGGAEETLEVEKVLVSTGRVPNADGLNLEAAGIRTEGNRIVVDNNFKTSVDGVYAIGDVNGKILLAHAASAQGIFVAERIMGRESKINLDIVPASIYTDPEVASVGMTEKEAKEKGLLYKVGRFPFKANGKALTMAKGEGFVKIIADEKYNEILGVHIIGPRATDMIAGIAVAMKMEGCVEDIAHTIHAHPTLTEAIMEAAHDYFGEVIHMA